MAINDLPIILNNVGIRFLADLLVLLGIRCGYVSIRHPIDNLFDMSCSAIDRGEAGSGFIENQIEVGTGKNDGIDAITLAESSGNSTQSRLIALRASALYCKLHVDAMDFANLDIARAYDINPVEDTEQLTVDCEFRTEKRNTTKPALPHKPFCYVQHVDERK